MQAFVVVCPCFFCFAIPGYNFPNFFFALGPLHFHFLSRSVPPRIVTEAILVVVRSSIHFAVVVFLFNACSFQHDNLASMSYPCICGTCITCVFL